MAHSERGDETARGSGLTRVATVLASLALLLAACGGNAAPAASSAVSAGASAVASVVAEASAVVDDTAIGDRLCALLAGPAVEAALTAVGGGSVANAVADEDGCNYELDDLSGGIDFRREATSIDQGVKLAFPDGVDVTGIADKAYWVPNISTLYFERGGETYTVQLIILGDTPDEQKLALATALAQAALAGGL